MLQFFVLRFERKIFSFVRKDVEKLWANFNSPPWNYWAAGGSFGARLHFVTAFFLTNIGHLWIVNSFGLFFNICFWSLVVIVARCHGLEAQFFIPQPEVSKVNFWLRSCVTTLTHVSHVCLCCWWDRWLSPVWCAASGLSTMSFSRVSATSESEIDNIINSCFLKYYILCVGSIIWITV